MSTDPTSLSPDFPTPRLHWQSLLAVACILAVFAWAGGWPVPDVNEPHYVGKAKSYWDPDWIRNDFFLDSTDSHLVFYIVVGGISWLPADLLAWTGRWITWALLAIAWYRLHRAVGGSRWWSPVSAAWFVLLNQYGEMAGEWAVGGFEAKGLAYALVLIALERMMRGHWNAAWCWLGGATSLHVLVGGWATVAAGIAWIGLGPARPAWRTMVPGLMGAMLLAAPGVWVALRLTWGIDPGIVREANDIYVLGRLRHHLDPLHFEPVAIARFVLLCVVWLALAWAMRRDTAGRAWRGFVHGSLLIALGGVAIAWTLLPWSYIRVDLLRFYWFRLSDVMIPLGVSLGLVIACSRLLTIQRRAGLIFAGLLIGVAGWYVGDQISEIATMPAPRSFRVDQSLSAEVQRARFDDWVAACDWARTNTLPEDRFLTPRMQSTFKWYARRPEVVTWKDVPQDAPGLVAWWERLRDIYRVTDETGHRRWASSLSELPAERLRELSAEYDATYVLTRAEPRIALDVAYQNNSYTIYRIAPAR